MPTNPKTFTVLSLLEIVLPALRYLVVATGGSSYPWLGPREQREEIGIIKTCRLQRGVYKADTQISDENKMLGCSSVSVFGVKDNEDNFASVGKSETWIHLLL